VVAPLVLLLACEGASDASAPADTAETADTADTDDTADTAPEDTDGDGYVAPEDCDDTDASVYPGAPDWCDGTDQDCDGEPAPPGACTGLVDLAPRLRNSFIGDTTDTASFWIATDNGAARSRFSQFRWTSPAGELVDNGIEGILEGLPSKPEDDWTAYAVGFWLGDDTAVLGDSLLDAGDFDGDGERDVWLSAVGGYDTLGRAFLVRGPESRWPRSGLPVEEGSDAIWDEESSGYGFAHDVEGGEDLDGDGLADALVWQSGGGDYDLARLYVLPGRAGASGRFAAADETTIGLSAYDGRYSTDDPGSWDEWASDPRILPDLDGDGLPEVSLKAAPYGLALASGPEALAGDGATMEEVFSLVPWGPDLQMTLLTGMVSPGDVDGDGYDDLLARSQEEGGYLFCLRWMSLEGRVPDTLVDTTVMAVCESSTQGPTLQLTEHAEWDLDGDGIRDVLYEGVHSDSVTDWEGDVIGGIFPSSRMAPGTWDLEETLLAFTDSTLPERGYVQWSDLDRNGVPELLRGETLDRRGLVYVIPNFTLPPGDSVAWE
jgi:hypothetical protein